jgi:hypothetical protein
MEQVPMRVTLDIQDEIHAKLKARAKEEGTTMREIVLEGLDKKLEVKALRRVERLEFPVLKSTRPGTLVIDNETIYDIIDFP